MASKMYIWMGAFVLFCSYYTSVEAGNCVNLWGDNLKDKFQNLYADGFSDICPIPIFGGDNEYCCYNYMLKPSCCPFGSFLLNMALLIGAVIIILGLMGFCISCICCKVF